MHKALQKLLFIDGRTKDLTAKGKVLYAISLFIPVVIAMYIFLFPAVGDALGFIIALVVANWLALPIKELLYSRYTFGAQARELKQKTSIFKQ